MATYTLNVQIDLEELPKLKKAGYILCLARRVKDGEYNVIWQGKKEFMFNDHFKWVQEYQVFATQEFESGALVQASSNTQDIAYEQQSVFTDAGVMKPPTSDPTPKQGTFKIKNEYNNMNFAVAGKVGGKFSVIYTTPDAIKADISFEPLNQVCVWFQKNVKTDTMISEIVGNRIEVSFGDLQTKSIVYTANGDWKLVG